MPNLLLIRTLGLVLCLSPPQPAVATELIRNPWLREAAKDQSHPRGFEISGDVGYGKTEIALRAADPSKSRFARFWIFENRRSPRGRFVLFGLKIPAARSAKNAGGHSGCLGYFMSPAPGT